MPFYKEKTEGLQFKVYIQPKSSKNMFCGRHEDSIKIKLTAPPVDGAANKMCIQFLSKYFRLPKSAIDIISGHTNRQKVILIRYPDNKPAAEEKERLLKLVEALRMKAK